MGRTQYHHIFAVIATLFVFASVLTTQVSCKTTADDDSDEATLTVGNYYSVDTGSDSTINVAFIGENITYFFMTQYSPVVYYTELPIYDASSEAPINLTLNERPLDDDPDHDGDTVIYDTQTNSLWVGGTDYMYLLNLTTGKVSTISQDSAYFVSSFVDVDRRTGYMLGGGSPPVMVKTNLDRFNASFFTDLTLDIFPVTSVFDSDTQIAFIGGTPYLNESCCLQVYDVATQESLQLVYDPDTCASNIASDMVYDPEHLNLYVCYDKATPFIIVYNITVGNNSTYSLTKFADLDMGSDDLSDGDLCAPGFVDKTSGQLFFGFTQGDDGVIGAWNLVDNSLTGFFGFEADPRSTYKNTLTSAIVDVVRSPNEREFYVLGLTQLIQVTYTTNCPSDCSDHGVCYYGVCNCTGDYVGDDCASKACTNDCSGNGVCSDGSCICYANYTSTDCSSRQCPNACSSHGTCSGSPDYLCTCTSGWTGTDCSTAEAATPKTCPELGDYSTCVGYTYCGWCGDITQGRCMTGDIVGPVAGSCSEWNFDDPPETGVIVIAAIILAIIGIMFVIDIWSAIRLDLQRGRELNDEYTTGLQKKPSLTEAAALWWRDQRAAKAWTTLEHLQFLSVYANLALYYPTRYLFFTRFMYWTNIALPLPFMRDRTFHTDRLTGYAATLGVAATTRELQGLEQYANTLEVLPKDLYADNIFWFGMLMLLFIVIYGFLSLIFIGRAHWRVVFSCRLVYMIFRIVSIGYMGLMMTSTYTLVSAEHDYRTMVPAALTVVIIGFGYPLAVWLILRGKSKQLFANEFRYKFGCLYVNYRPESSLFTTRIIMRKFITGVIAGFLAFNLKNEPKYVAIIQAIILGVVQILYVVELIRHHPYYDHFHEYLEYFLCAVNIASIALALIHYNHPVEAAYLISALIQILALVACFGTFIISWMQMHPGFSFKLWCANLCGKSAKDKSMMGSMPMDDMHNDPDEATIGVNQE